MARTMRWYYCLHHAHIPQIVRELKFRAESVFSLSHLMGSFGFSHSTFLNACRVSFTNRKEYMRIWFQCPPTAGVDKHNVYTYSVVVWVFAIVHLSVRDVASADLRMNCEFSDSGKQCCHIRRRGSISYSCNRNEMN